MQSQSTSSFSHIKVIPQERLPEADPNIPKAASPFLRKSSFQHDAEAALNSLDPSVRSTESLASHATGATFASKARAAELQAARARQELRTRSANDLIIPGYGDAENMGKKTKLTWKKYNYSSAQDDAEPEKTDESDEFLLVPNSPSKSLHLRENESWARVTGSSLASSEDNERKSGIQTGSQPAATTLEEVSGNSDKTPTQHLQYDVGLDRYVDGAGRNHELQASPTKSSVFEDEAYKTAELERLDEQSLRTTMKMATGMSPPKIAPKSKYHGFPSQVEMFPTSSHQFQLYDPSPFDFGVMNPTGLPAYTNDHHYSSVSTSALRPMVQFPETELRSHITQLRAKPPEFYPAVKGTKGDASRSAVAQRPTDIAPTPLYQTAESLEGLCLEDLEPGPRDCHSYVSPQFDGTTEQQSASAPSGQGSPLDDDDDILPNANRGVQIEERFTIPKWDEYPTVLGYCMTPDGIFPAGGEPREHRYYNPPERAFTHGMHDLPSVTVSSFHAAKQQAHATLMAVRARETMGRAALRAANFSDDPPPAPVAPAPSASASNEAAIEALLPALLHVSSYRSGSRHFSHDYFYRMGAAPEWAVDHGPGADRSFFGGDWGTPPARVGRDPRYRRKFTAQEPNAADEMLNFFEGKFNAKYLR